MTGCRTLDSNIITRVEGLPHDTLYKELRAEVDPSAIETATPTGTLTVRWFASDPTGPVRFTFHYSDESGFDCGWHHHEQDHVDGWGHYQQRQQGSQKYVYEQFQFGSKEPARVVWEVLELDIVHTDAREGDAEHTHADISKATELIGYEPSRDIREGVREFIAWYRQNRDWYEPLVIQS